MEARFQSNTELEKWLNANTWLEDAEFVAIEPYPKAAITPTMIGVSFLEWVRGTLVAGGERTVRPVKLRADGVTRSTLNQELCTAPGHCCEGLELLDADRGVSISVDVRCRRRSCWNSA